MAAGFDWLTTKGEAAALIRGRDWSDSPLGPPEQWPQSLRSAINLCLASKLPMYVWWGPQNINIYNDAYAVIAGRLRHPACFGRPAQEMWPEIWDTMEGFLAEVHRTGEAVFSENLVFHLEREGRTEDAYFTFSFNPAFDEEGQVRGAVAVVQETTTAVLANRDRQRAEEDLRAARQELQDFLMQAPIGIALLSGPEHVFTLANPTFMTLLFRSRPASDLLQKTVRQALPEIEGQGFHELLDDAYRTGKPFVGTKIRANLLQGDGVEREMFVNFTYQPKRDPSGRVNGLLVVVYEVTDQVNEQREIESLANNLRSALVSRDVFLGIASHELNTPLTSLKMQVQLNQRMIEKQGIGVMTPEQIRKLLSNLLLQCDRLGRLVNDMLDVSRISSGRLTMKMVETDLSALVRSTLERAQPQLDAAHSPVTIDIAPKLLIALDASRIEQVLMNLLTNAAKYAGGQPVHVEVLRDGDVARVSVRDSGMGIATEHHERIFGRFERATSANEVSGLGLGLYISRQIIEAHGGRIAVVSVPGDGCTFTFELPLGQQGDAHGGRAHLGH